MANPWFRVYTEFFTDPKMQMLSEAFQRRSIGTMALECTGELAKYDDNEIAFALRISADDWLATKNKLIEIGFLTPEGRVRNFQKRQYKSDVADPTNNERKKRFRERKRNGDGTVSGTPLELPDTDTDNKKESPIFYADNVSMTKTEHLKLMDEHGEFLTSAFITRLSNFKAANGKKYKSDYRAILTWVVDAVKKSHPQPSPPAKREFVL